MLNEAKRALGPSSQGFTYGPVEPLQRGHLATNLPPLRSLAAQGQGQGLPPEEGR